MRLGLPDAVNSSSGSAGHTGRSTQHSTRQQRGWLGACHAECCGAFLRSHHAPSEPPPVRLLLQLVAGRLDTTHLSRSLALAQARPRQSCRRGACGHAHGRARQQHHHPCLGRRAEPRPTPAQAQSSSRQHGRCRERAMSVAAAARGRGHHTALAPASCVLSRCAQPPLLFPHAHAPVVAGLA